ncbi:alanine-synthesizing transaminase [Tamilnaduibacter salinus]|uniref:alanine transaminase n=1 Tax=Tamilnaduibacter salinus TaxID=1484056 RepID=A0A2A2I614_9GAMM|nr:pyridoxal phosphate-dependent aminotransferase [Tamilnaduibacter salinus]PAV26746.1 aminotransferase [Tamilnaduibacter salinus]PVY75355.1 alanine-synthesizing transaminase [Tamilnaduibacter salinus]
MQNFKKSTKLDDVCYDIRGPVLREARRLEEEGNRVLKLNIGNPAAFELDVPEEIQQDVIYNMHSAQGYVESKGLFSARKAVMHYCQRRGINKVEIDDIYLGNGVSEMIVMSMQALLNTGDEVLIPAPDYPLWTAAVTLSSGRPVHYVCDEAQDWFPDIDDIKSKITTHTRAIVLINPNNPTGSVYSKELLEQVIELARQHDLIILADEIYDKILYDGVQHVPAASLADDVLFFTYNGLSKNYRAAGYRSGWMIISGAKHRARNLIEGIDMLASMRLCSNVPAQLAIQTALGGYQSIEDLVAPEGRLYEQRDIAYRMLNDIPGISCVKPQGALYMFPKLDPKRFPIEDDERLAYDLLQQEKILLVQGSAFNINDRQHMRVVFLPRVDTLEDAISRLGNFLEHYQQ